MTAITRQDPVQLELLRTYVETADATPLVHLVRWAIGQIEDAQVGRCACNTTEMRTHVRGDLRFCRVEELAAGGEGGDGVVLEAIR